VLGSIERVGREAMRDLDGILGLLADEEDAADQGLEEALRALLASLPAEVTAELRVPGAALEGLGPEAAAAVRRVVQESLTNVIRHARPAHAVVEVERGADWVQVSVRDNGSGTVAQSSRQGRGLAGMRERVAALGGEWESGPLDSGGWRNRARLPLTEETA
jgi:signal transduction histidine kinase